MTVSALSRLAAIAVAAVILQPAVHSGAQPLPTESNDSQLIRGARIIDGTGTSGHLRDLRIQAGRIAAVGDLEPHEGEAIVEAEGLVLTPGFIDTHSHHDVGLANHPQAIAAISQGVTTIVVGQDGSSNSPLAESFRTLEESPTAINVASFTGHGTLRNTSMGASYQRSSTPEELERMLYLLDREMKAGSLGLSSGLGYDPGLYAPTEELIELARAAGVDGGRYITHMRSEDREIWTALAEAIRIGREAGVAVHLSHLKLGMRSLWGKAGQLLDQLDAARAEGVDLSADVYPYFYWQSTMTLLFPNRDFRSLEAARYALEELASPEGITVARFGPEPEYVGKTLSQIATIRDSEPAQTLIDIFAEARAWERDTGHDGESVLVSSMSEGDVGSLLGWDHTNLGSDGALGGRHPRGFGTFPRFVARFGPRGDGMSLELAVHKMSGLAALHMGIEGRGVIRPGAAADLVLFDPTEIEDRATPEQPNRTARGIRGVWVNGILVWDGKRWTGALPGQVVRGKGLESSE